MKKAVFIHSLFRTGSTYIWNKFRKNPRFYCYYEPFHQVLSEVTADNLQTALTTNYELVGHPMLDKYYLYEYGKLLEGDSQKGVPFFDKSFSFDLFCLDEKNPHLKGYIDNLIENAADRIPVFQFNRSAKRTGWFKTQYPDSLNIYILRNPRDQWQSYFELFKKTSDPVFFVMDIITASVNADQEPFKPLKKYLPLIEYNHEDFNKEKEFYQLIAEYYSTEEKYSIFYYTWLMAYIENVLNADFVLNINQLSSSASYKKELETLLLNHTGEKLDFNDAHIREYSNYQLSADTMDKIEKEMQQLLLHSLTEEQTDRFLRKVSNYEKQYYQLNEDILLQKKRLKLKPLNIEESIITKFNAIILLLSDKYFKQLQESKAERAARSEELQKLNIQLQESEADRKARLEQIKKLDQQLQESEVDRDARLKQIEKIGNHLQESETIRKEKLEQIKELNEQLLKTNTELKLRNDQIRQLDKQLREANEDRKARLEQIKKLDKQLQESEADRKARLEQLEQLGKKLQVSAADNKARFEQINKLSKWLKEAEDDRKARLEQINKLGQWLKEAEADRKARLEQIKILNKQLKEANVDPSPRKK